MKESLRKKFTEYLARAEKLKEYLQNLEANKTKGMIGEQEVADSSNKKVDAENDKLRAALSSVVLTEKPNVKWEDVAGLDQAQESLKEAVILPIKFPHLFQGKRTPVNYYFNN